MNPIDWFLAHKVNVFPIRPGTKQPEVVGSWKGYRGPRPTGSYGVELGTLIVIDGDSATNTAWIRAHVPATPFRVQTGPHHDGTPGRGVHFYFRSPAAALPAFIHRDGLVIEVRRLGQYVLGPRSTHPSGCTYKPSIWSWDWNDVPVFPADFQFDDGTGRTSPLGAPYEVPDCVTAGERTHELFRYVRSLKALGASEAEARFAVEVFNRDRMDPPKSDEWLRAWFPRAWHNPDRPDFGSFTFPETTPTAIVPPEVTDGE